MRSSKVGRASSVVRDGLFSIGECGAGRWSLWRRSDVRRSAALVDGRFGAAQTFDVQWSYDGGAFTLSTSSFITPLDSTGTASSLAPGQAYGFFPSTTVPGTFGLAIYASNNTLVRVLHQTGTFHSIGPEAIFYLGGGEWGTLITTARGYSNGDSASFVQTTTSPTDAQVGSYVWPSLTPLEPGEVAGGVSAINTHLSINTTAQIVRNQLLAREASLVSVLGYDSNEFGKNNVSVSFIGRYSELSDSRGEGAGALVVAFKVHPNVRVGEFFDYAVARDIPTVISYSNALPTFGAYAVYEANDDLTGLSARLAAAYNHGHMTITRRATLEDTEGGAGKAGLRSFGVTAEVGYGVRIAPTFVAVPYLGIRYTEVTRGAYTEAVTDEVTKPITYDVYSQKLTTALGGVRVHGKFGENVALFVGVGAEYDLDRNIDAYSGTSSISGLPNFTVATTGRSNRLCGSVVAGAGYRLSSTQTLSAQIAVRQQAFSAEPAVTFMVKYSVGF